MSRHMKQKRVGGPQAPLPIKGMLVTEGESESSLALRMMVEQLTSFQQQQQLQFAAMNAALSSQTERLKQLQLEIATVKQGAAEALAETRTKMQELMERKPTDPQTLQKMVATAQQTAASNAAAAKARFLSELETMPRGHIFNDEGQSIRFIINGTACILRPGHNQGIPACFIEAWDSRKKQQLWAAGLDAAFQMRDEAGDFLASNHYNDALASAGVESDANWDANSGVIATAGA